MTLSDLGWDPTYTAICLLRPKFGMHGRPNPSAEDACIYGRLCHTTQGRRGLQSPHLGYPYTYAYDIETIFGKLDKGNFLHYPPPRVGIQGLKNLGPPTYIYSF